MAILAKKIYMTNSAGTQQTALIYSTTGESGTPYMYASDGSTTGYVPLCSTSDVRATSGRVIQSGTTYAIANNAGVTYDYQYALFTSTGTFTVPAYVTRLRVTCVGGGAGVLTYHCSPDHNEVLDLGSSGYVDGATYWSGSGGSSSFSTVVAGGAGGNSVTFSTYACVTGRETTATCGKFTNPTVGGGRILGAVHGTDQVAGTAGYTIYRADTGGALGTFGGGGGGGGDHNSDTICPITGSSGYVSTATITVTPGTTITAIVGGGGGYWSSHAYVNENGTAGCVFVEWGRSIT